MLTPKYLILFEKKKKLNTRRTELRLNLNNHRQNQALHGGLVHFDNLNVPPATIKLENINGVFRWSLWKTYVGILIANRILNENLSPVSLSSEIVIINL
jgi:hypothetical protein